MLLWVSVIKYGIEFVKRGKSREKREWCCIDYLPQRQAAGSNESTSRRMLVSVNDAPSVGVGSGHYQVYLV